MATQAEKLTGSDAEYGYRFGSSGLMTVPNVVKFCGRSRRTVLRMVDRGVLRRGTDPDTGAILICRRSIDEYLKSIQE